MFKSILISGVLCTLLSAQNFETFLQKALTESPYLHASSLEILQAAEQGAILQRYKNPSLELEYSHFTPQNGSDAGGYRVNYSQPIQLWGLQSAKQQLATKLSQTATADYEAKKALYMRTLSLLYVEYMQASQLEALAEEASTIAKKIFTISQVRYEKGRIAKGVLLQAQIDYERAVIGCEELRLATQQSYYSLLSFAGVKEEIRLSTHYTFTPLMKKQQHPQMQLLALQNKAMLSQAELLEHSLSWVNLFAEYEEEPEQEIMRVGLTLPLPIFNTKSQEKKLATLKAKEKKISLEATTTRVAFETKLLNYERASLLKQKTSNAKVLQNELRLLEMYEEGYKIANVKLLALQEVKNRVIQTKKKLIYIESGLNKNAILTNYNQGNYND